MGAFELQPLILPLQTLDLPSLTLVVMLQMFFLT
jgi:hypothetical protein